MNSRPKYPLEDLDGTDNTGSGIGRGPEAGDLEFDQKWIQLAQLDLEKFSKLYRKYQPKIYAFICWMVQDADIASDLTDETFFQALDRLDSFKWRGVTVGAWFFRIAHNLVAMEFKRQRIESEKPFDPNFLDFWRSVLKQAHRVGRRWLALPLYYRGLFCGKPELLQTLQRG